jgi:carboxylate-amine ligase
MPLQLQPPSEAVVIFVRVSDELDIANAPAVEAALRGAEEAGADEIVLDLSDLRFMGSAGLHVILQADERARRGGYKLTLLTSNAVRRITDLAGMTAWLPIAA